MHTIPDNCAVLLPEFEVTARRDIATLHEEARKFSHREVPKVPNADKKDANKTSSVRSRKYMKSAKELLEDAVQTAEINVKDKMRALDIAKKKRDALSLYEAHLKELYAKQNEHPDPPICKYEVVPVEENCMPKEDLAIHKPTALPTSDLPTTPEEKYSDVELYPKWLLNHRCFSPDDVRGILEEENFCLQPFHDEYQGYFLDYGDGPWCLPEGVQGVLHID